MSKSGLESEAFVRSSPLAPPWLLVLITFAIAGAACAEQPPNVVIIVADDVGVDKVSAYAEGTNPPSTPNIDSIANDGVLFRNAWANPVCSSTRAALLSGLYGFRTGVGFYISDPNTDIGLDPTQSQLPKMLNAHGFATAAFGKWHVAGCPRHDGVCSGEPANAAAHPIESGFDSYAGALGNFKGGEDYCNWTKTTSRREGTRIVTEQVVSHDYATLDTARDAVAYIERAIQQDHEPFFAWIAFNASHTPLHRVPENPIGCSASNEGTRLERYDAMTEALDAQIGEVLAAIEPVRAHTIVIFLGDNGTIRHATLAPFVDNRSKGSPYEGGANVPFMVRGPRGVVGTGESTALINTTDVLSTVAELVVASLDVSGTARDSASFASNLRDPAAASSRNWVYSEKFFPNGFRNFKRVDQAVRGARYKLIRRVDRKATRVEFYDLKEDPFEKINLLSGTLTPEQELARAELLATFANLKRPNERSP